MADLPAYLVARSKARQQYDAAFHLLNVTFPLVKDPKLLMGVIHNLFSSLEGSMEAILAYERELSLTPAYPDNFQSKFNLFRYKSVKRNRIPQELVDLVVNLRSILALHQTSPMEFQRGNKLVICNKDYQLQIISLNDLKRYLQQTQEFIQTMEKVINRFK